MRDTGRWTLKKFQTRKNGTGKTLKSRKKFKNLIFFMCQFGLILRQLETS